MDSMTNQLRSEQPGYANWSSAVTDRVYRKNWPSETYARQWLNRQLHPGFWAEASWRMDNGQLVRVTPRRDPAEQRRADERPLLPHRIKGAA